MSTRRHKAIGTRGFIVYAGGSIEADPELDKAAALEHLHDGDTININPDGYLPVRCLAIDTPEVSFSLRFKSGFSADTIAWEFFRTPRGHELDTAIERVADSHGYND